MDKYLDIENPIEEESLVMEHQNSEDLYFLRNKKWTDHQDKESKLKNVYKKNGSIMNMVSNVLFNMKNDEVADPIYVEILKESFDSVSPLIYLSNDQRKAFLEGAKYLKFGEKTTIYSGMEGNLDAGHWGAFILLKGEVHIFDNKLNFSDLINKVHFFGYDGPIFGRR